MNEPVDYGEQDVVKLPDGGTAYRLRYKKSEADKPRYLIVKNEFKDRGGIPGLLTYTAEAGNRITIEQQITPTTKTVVRPGAQGPTSKPSGRNEHETGLKWHVRRFEAREKSLGEENKFDSLRDSYPIAPLRRLGTSNGAQLTFERDGWTGIAERIRIQPGRITGPATRRKLSKTAQKCLIDNNNVRELLDAIGPLILPRTPRRIGESWTRTRDKEIRNFGKSVTTFRLTLDRVKAQPDGPLVAHVTIDGSVKLMPDPAAAADKPKTKDDKGNTTSRPAKAARRGRRTPPKDTHRDFKLDSSLVSGEYSFDITHGMLLDYTLKRNSALSAEMESKEFGKMSLVSAESHTLRVETTTTEPPKPIIVGGPKPPKDDPKDLVRTPAAVAKKKNRLSGSAKSPSDKQRARAKDYAERRREALERLRKRREAAMKRRGLTTQPATSQPAWPPHRGATTRPAAGRHRRPTTQTGRVRPRVISPVIKPIVRKRPTTQPARPNGADESKSSAKPRDQK